MSTSVGTVENLSGKFFTKDTSGNIVEQKNGDTISEGMTVFGDKNNPATASIEIAMSSDNSIVSLHGTQQQLFDASTVQDANTVDDALAKNSVDTSLNSDTYANDNAVSDDKADNKDQVVDGDTAAGDDKPKSEDGGADHFAARDGNMVDVNSGLRDAKFKLTSHNFELKSIFNSESEHNLSPIAHNDPFQPTTPTTPERPTPIPVPVPPVTPPTPTPPVTPPLKPALFGEVSLDGDTLVKEGDTASYRLTVTNPPLTALNIVVRISHIDTNNGDITPKTMTVTIPAGQTSATFNVSNIDSDPIEPNEQYHVGIVSTNGGGYDDITLGNTGVNTTIIDNGPSLVIDDVTKNEDDGSMTFTVTLSRAIGSDVTFDYSSASGTATSGSDYSAVNGHGTITAGTTTTTITVPIIDDYLTENSEKFTINLSNPSNNATIADAQGVGTILDTGSEPNTTSPVDTVYLQLAGNDTAHEGAGETLTHTFTLVDKDGHSVDLPMGETINVTLTYAGISGVDGVESADFTTKTTTFTITGDGGSSYNVSNTVADDYLAEGTEGYTVSIGSIDATSGTFENVAIDTANNSAEGRIVDGVNDQTPNQAVDTVYLQLAGNDTAHEGAGETLTHTFTLVDKDGHSVDLPMGETINVTLTYAGISGVDGVESADFTTKTTTFTITGDGGSSYNVSNTVADDYLAEGTEGYTVSIGSIDATSGTFENVAIDTANNSAEGRIVDGVNDQTPNQAVDTVYVKLVNSDTAFEGSDLTHKVQLVDKDGNPVTVASGETITVTVGYTPAVTDGATTPADYTATTTVTITGGHSETTFTNATINDFTAENTETYTAAITAVSQANASYENVAVSSTANSVTGTIQDGVSIGAPIDAFVDENNFSITTTNSTIHDTQLLSISAPAASNGYSLAFDNSAVPTFTSDSGSYTTLTSNGTAVEYVYNGATVTAYAGSGRTASDKVFDVVLNKNSAGGSDDSYTYTQYKNIDHPTANSSDNIVLNFGFKVSEGGVSSPTETFSVTVKDSVPTAGDQALSTNEDSSKVIVISQESFINGTIHLNNHVDLASDVTSGSSISIYDADGTDVVGTLTNNGNGTLTFHPSANYSGSTDGFSYSVTDSDGDTAVGNIGLTVNPVSDKATIADGSAITHEDVAVAIGLHAPVITDNTDLSGATAGDYTEKLGAIELYNMASGAQIEDGSGTALWTSTGTSSKLYILLSDGDHEAGTVAGFPLNSSNHIKMTTDQFEALKVNPVAQAHNDIDIKMGVTEYEVDASGTKLPTVAGASQTHTFHVEVLAVTDPISLAFDNSTNGTISTTTNADDTYTATTSLTEGSNVIDLKGLLTPTSGSSVDLDGSEKRSYTVWGIPEGTIINLGGTTATANSLGAATVNFSGTSNTQLDPTFTMTPPAHFSGQIDATIRLRVYDTDSDSTTTTIAYSQTVYFHQMVTAVANAVTLQVAQAKGYEDAGRSAGNTVNDGSASVIDHPENGIPLHINVTSADTDGSEKYTVVIESIPTGAVIYYNGIEVAQSPAGTVSISNFSNTTPLTIVPPHNSDVDFTLQVKAHSVDSDGTNTFTGSDSAALALNVQVIGVADVPVNDTLATTTVNDDTSTAQTFNLATTEDSSVNLKDVLATPDTLASYDGDTSEALTIKVTGLATGFDISGATFLGGSGTSRIWFVDVADLKAGNVTLTTPQNYAGEVDFKMNMITTEREGDSKTHPQQDIAVMVTPVVDASMHTTDTQNEDQVLTLDFGLDKPDSDGASAGVETLTSFGIDLSTVDAGVILKDSHGNVLVDSGDGYAYLNVTNGVLEAVTATLPPNSHMNGSYNFGIKYTITDVATDVAGHTYTDTKNATDTYTVHVNAVTDTDTTLSVASTLVTGGVSESGGTVTVLNNGTFTQTLDLHAPSDTDGSEHLTRIEVYGIPQGVSVVGGHYAGNVDGNVNTGVWYVDVNPDEAINSADIQHNLMFNVDGTPIIGSYTITVKAFNQDVGASEHANATTFNMDISNSAVFTNTNIGTPATIDSFYQDINQDNTDDTSAPSDAVYAASVIREDTQFALGSVVDVNTTNSSDFAITLKNVPAGVHVEGMTYSSSSGFYTIHGSGDSAAVLAALNAILITPAANSSTDANNISSTDLNFDVELTTYSTGGAQNTSLINFTGSVLPVTDSMTLTTVNDGTTAEDTAQTFSVTLGNAADGSNTVIVGGKAYVQLNENYTDAQGTDGINGVLTVAGHTMTVQTVDIGNGSQSYYVIDGVVNNETLNFSYEPASNRDGSVSVDIYVKNQEAHNWSGHDAGTLLSTQTVTFNVTSVHDGFTFDTTSTPSVGFEDVMTQVSVAVTNPDSSEKLLAVSLDNVPDGFLVYYGADAAHAVLARNMGTNGTTSVEMTYGTPEVVTSNLWNIPLNAGDIPAYIGIRAPQNWSGTIPSLSFDVIDNSGETHNAPFDITINPVVDTLTMDVSKTFGNEGEDISLNLNANIQDLDGSETVTLTLDGLGAGAAFKANGTEINSADISYDTPTDTYTIAHIASSDINSLSFVQSNMSGTVNVTAQMFESDGSHNDAQIINGSFSVDIAAVNVNDTFTYDGTTPINGYSGTDTVQLASGITFDYSKLDNIEKIDLTANGNHTVSNLTLNDVLDITDSHNTLEITGSATDKVDSVNTTGWTKDSATHSGTATTYVYHDATSSVTLTVDDNVNNTGL